MQPGQNKQNLKAESNFGRNCIFNPNTILEQTICFQPTTKLSKCKITLLKKKKKKLMECEHTRNPPKKYRGQHSLLVQHIQSEALQNNAIRNGAHMHH